MRIARFKTADAIAFGIYDEDGGKTQLVELVADPMFAGYETTGRRFDLDEVTLLAPVIPRSKIVCVGKNYAAHAEEMGGTAPEAPLLFLKPNTAVIGPDDAIVIPPQSERVEHEGELAIVIGKLAKNVAAKDAMDVVFGFTCANDVTARDLQQADGQWARGKGFDTFCPLGPAIETELDLSDTGVRTLVNGELRQEGSTRDLIHSIERIIEYSSSVWTMLPGDVILTGTPAGVGPLVAGDVVEVQIDGIGTLRNTVR